MNLVKYNPWFDKPAGSWLAKFFDDDAFVPFSGAGEHFHREGFVPAVDISETEDAIKLEAELPGIDKKDIQIELRDGVLVLKGERKHEVVEDKKDNYYRVERHYGSFQRSFSVPDTIDSDKIKADYKNGVLSITLPKAEKAKPKQIKVTVH